MDNEGATKEDHLISNKVRLVRSSSNAISSDSGYFYLLTPRGFTLTDKAIHPYNSALCQGLQAISTDTPYSMESNATLYLLNTHPSQTDHERIEVLKTFDLHGYQQYQSYKLKMSADYKVLINACYESGEALLNIVKFYVIKGENNYNQWVSNRFSQNPYSELSGSKCQNVSYEVPNDDIYYFSFHLALGTSVTLKIRFLIDRDVYHISLDSIVDECKINLDGHSSCSISVPMSSGYTALLSLETTLPVNYYDGADIQIDCQPRVWLCVVIAILCLVVLVTLTAVLVVICVKLRRKNRGYSFVNRDSSAVDSTNTTCTVKPTCDSTSEAIGPG